MGLKSAYREKIPAKKEYLADKGPPPSEKLELNPDPAADAIESNPAVALAIETSRKADEATERLRKQLADLQRAEGMARQAAMQGRPLNHVEKLEAWRAQGMNPDDYQFLMNNPDMVVNDRLTALAAHEAAQQGHERGTDAHRQATREIFNQRLGHMRRVNPEPEPPELELDVPKPPPPPPQPDQGAMYAAPVSREVQGSGYRPSPSSVRLTIEQREAARLAGISEVEYARQFAKLPQYKKDRGVEYE
jgi:hypothetical protein